MTAKRYLLRTYEGRYLRRVGEANLDPADDGRLREVLEQQVKAAAGTLSLDLSRWRMVVYDANRHVRARVSISPSGATVVKR